MLHLQQHGSAQILPQPQMIKALLIDDSNFDRARIRRMSSKTDLIIDLDEVDSIEEMDAAVSRAAYDLIMIDYLLPSGNGLMALEQIHLNPLNQDAGTIMITGNAGLDTAVNAMRSGCHDFLTKDEMDAERLRTAMMNALATANDRRMIAVQVEHQRDVMRRGLKAALQDEEVQGVMISMMRHHLSMVPAQPALARDLSPGDTDALLAGFSDDDEFIFQ